MATCDRPSFPQAAQRFDVSFDQLCHAVLVSGQIHGIQLLFNWSRQMGLPGDCAVERFEALAHDRGLFIIQQAQQRIQMGLDAVVGIPPRLCAGYAKAAHSDV